MTAAIKPSRDYLRVPHEIRNEIQELAVRCDVPLHSVTRFLLGLGLEVTRIHPARAHAALEQYRASG